MSYLPSSFKDNILAQAAILASKSAEKQRKNMVEKSLAVNPQKNKTGMEGKERRLKKYIDEVTFKMAVESAIDKLKLTYSTETIVKQALMIEAQAKQIEALQARAMKAENSARIQDALTTQ
jgi:type IV secretory pathway VirB4 component